MKQRALHSGRRARQQRGTARAGTGPKTGYAPVNGLNLYYEIHGSGEPLILLHGGVVGIDSFSAILPALAKGRRVIAVELQGHGRTPDVGLGLEQPVVDFGVTQRVSPPLPAMFRRFVFVESTDKNPIHVR